MKLSDDIPIGDYFTKFWAKIKSLKPKKPERDPRWEEFINKIREESQPTERLVYQPTEVSEISHLISGEKCPSIIVSGWSLPTTMVTGHWTPPNQNSYVKPKVKLQLRQNPKVGDDFIS